ncbi:ribosomal RNA small subunit methyltransferase H, partial [Striga asiatica]
MVTRPRRRGIHPSSSRVSTIIKNNTKDEQSSGEANTASLRSGGVHKTKEDEMEKKNTRRKFPTATTAAERERERDEQSSGEANTASLPVNIVYWWPDTCQRSRRFRVGPHKLELFELLATYRTLDLKGPDSRRKSRHPNPQSRMIESSMPPQLISCSAAVEDPREYKPS